MIKCLLAITFIFGTGTGGSAAAQVRNFHMRLSTNFRDIDFPDNALSPGVRSETPNGWRLA